ncbi:AAA family ATPase [Paenarthrobacter ureafaciens]|uniref:ATP-binding protein n=1 Tax=Paenarthrobacter TaxID=1742992 RepID=UPI0022316EC6|nr:ATP-binding protein [Paenarthrobacter sp. PAE-2]MCW3764915.1 ATP-binding protein [Paenarthrobacter sp. PAE-2]
MLPDPWLDEDTVAAGLGPSALPDRRQLLELIVGAIASPSTNGIVVVGDKGSGKSHLLLSIQAGLPESMDVRTFAGTPELEAVPFGALTSRAEAAGEYSGLPGLHVFRALTAALGPADYLYTPAPRRRGRKSMTARRRPPLVLLVDDIHHVDPDSLAVLLQLMPGFGATLVATADSRRPLPQDLYQLWEDGFLEQYLLPPFTFQEAQALCEDLLGGRIQRRVSGVFAVISGFNAGLLCLAVEDARRAELLVHRRGFWTLDPSARCRWPGVVEYVAAENALCPPEERQALEVIALGEPVALETVERSFGQRTMDNLLAANRIRLIPGSPPMVRTSSWLWGEGTRLSVPRSRSTALRIGVEGPKLTKESAPAMLRWMTWTLDSGLSLSDELILSAAPAADSPSTAELALRAAAAVKEPGNVPEAKLLRARALIAEGQLQAATPELRALATADRQPGVRSAAASRLAALSLMGAAPVPAAADVSEPATAILDAVRDAGQLLTAGNAPEALARSTAAVLAIGAEPELEIFRPGVLLRHAMCLRYNLAWAPLEAVLHARASYAMPAHLAGCLEVARGYAQLSQGLPRAARRTLEPVVADMADAGLPLVLAFAAAMLAFCEAQDGAGQEAKSSIAQSQAALAEAGPLMLATDSGLLRDHCALFIVAAQDYVDGAGPLLGLAGDFHAGNAVIEAEALSLLALKAGSAVVDDLPLLNRLGGLAENLEGAGGASLRTFVQAWSGGEPRALEAAGRSLAGNRQFAHAALCYAAAAERYGARARGAASRRASLMAERLRAVIDSGDVPPLGWLPGPAGR